MSQKSVVELGKTEKHNSGCSINDERVSETVIAINENSPDLSCSQEPAVAVSVAVVVVDDVVRNSENRSSDPGESCATAIAGETKVAKNRDEKKSWVIEDGEICDGDIICRICHLNSEQPWKFPFFAAKTDLIMLGCGCKGDLGVAHSYCAEAWFKLKGNRICEICGEVANNVRGVGNESFMEEWKDTRSRRNANATDSSDRSAEGCWQGQPLCNFLMACLVIAFVLPWFFRINMF